MRYRAQIVLLLLTAFAAVAPAVSIQTVTKDDLELLKRKPCTLIHLWASWCGPCVKELPKLLEALPKIENLNPVVIDVSSPNAQEHNSKPLLERIAPSIPLYKKAAGDEDPFMNAMDPKWSGALPYSVLFHRGRAIKKWEGPLDLTALRKAVGAVCHASKR